MPEPDAKLDAPPPPADGDGGGGAAKAARDVVDRAISTVKKDVESATRLTADRADRHSKNEFARLGIKLADADPGVTKLVPEWRKENVGRITGMLDDQLGKIERVLEDGANHRVETLAKEIRRQCIDVSVSRAELIARDQVLTLNAQITKQRQTNAGVERYVWTTSNDERVREEHQELEGKTFSWDDPPGPGHPGEDYQCRCVAFPVLPELDEEAKDEERAEPVSLPEPEEIAPPPPDEESSPPIYVPPPAPLAEAKVVQAEASKALREVEPPTNVGTLPNGNRIEFQPHERQERQRKDYVTIMVDRAALDRAWQKDRGYYIPSGGGGPEIGGRRDNFRKFLDREDRPPIQASQVAIIDGEGASFIDGRHRFSMLRDMGIDRVAITIEKPELKLVPKDWNATLLKD